MASSLDVELLLDRLLSASTPSDCIDSLEKLQRSCQRRRRKPRPSSTLSGADGDGELLSAFEREELAESERVDVAVDTIVGNTKALAALCSLVALSVLPSPRDDDAPSINDATSGVEVEGGDIAACELLFELLPTPSSSSSSSSATEQNKTTTATTTAALQKQRQLKRRTQFISKTLLHFHESDTNKNDTRLHGSSNNNNMNMALIPSLLDCLCASHVNTPVYARVLSLQILQSLLAASPGALREQLMKAPDGINRLVDLLGHDSTSPVAVVSLDEEEGGVPEEVRNQAILFLTHLASSSSVLARLITFSEGYDRALKIALESGGGKLTAGSTIAMDCLELCLALAHADDVARELFLGGGDGRGNLDRLAMLIDLRGGERFVSKERNVWWDAEMKRRREEKGVDSSVSGTTVAKSEDDVKRGGDKKKGKRGKQRKDDDLDDILRVADTATTSPKSAATSKEDNVSSKQSQPIKSNSTGPPVPYLTPNETTIVDSICNLLLALLYDGDYKAGISQYPRSATDASRMKRRGRAKTIASHDLLARSIVDCALYTLPPPGVDFVSAVPPPALQQKALMAMAVLGSMGDTIPLGVEDSGNGGAAAVAKKEEEEEAIKLQSQLLFETMPLYLHGRVTAMERLMYLACTGAFLPESDTYDNDQSAEAVASLLSTNALSTFRSCMPKETATRMVLHALAPPPPDEVDAPSELPVVTKLVTTLTDNLRFIQSQQQERKGEGGDMANIYSATIGASGSAGALGVFLTKGDGDATREMLLRMPPPPAPPAEHDESGNAITDATEVTSLNLIDLILQHVALYDPSGGDDERHSSVAYVTFTLLRLLAEWIEGMPKAVADVLCSPSSVSLGVLVRSNEESNSSAARAVPAMSGLLLVLCLEYMPDASDSDMENASWTQETIMNMIQSMGVSKYLNMMDEWKKRPLPLPFCPGEFGSSIERRSFSKWYGNSVTLVRRRIVMTLAGSVGENKYDSDTVGGDESNASVRSLRKMVSSQAREVEDLQLKLDEALQTISTQSTQIRDLKRVAELGTSAEANDMLSEYADKVAELEKEKGQLVNKAEKQAELNIEALSAKDNDIESIREELQQAKLAVEEIQREKDCLHEEMAGLSAAYLSLEQEYRTSNTGHSTDISHEMTAGGETAAEDGGSRVSSAGGEAAAEDPNSHNHQLMQLQDENTRLREDVRAANEWMTMAVSRMDELRGENESLSRSLEEARSQTATPNVGRVADVNEMKALRDEIHRLQGALEIAASSAEANLRAKEEDLANLRGQIEQMSQSLSVEQNQKSTPEQALELESLRQANKDAQVWMASAVAHVDSLTKEVEELKMKNAALVKTNAETATGRSDNAARLEELEQSISAVTKERNDLQTTLVQTNEQMERIRTQHEELQKSIDGSKSPNTVLQEELTQLKATNENLQSSLAEFQAWSESAQIRMAEMETKLQEATAERDDLKARLVQTPVVDGTAEARVNEQIESLQGELRRKDDEIKDLQTQLEQVQSQLIDDSEENEAAMEQLRIDLKVTEQRLEQLRQKEAESLSILSTISSEKDQLANALSNKEAEVASLKANEVNSSLQVEEANRRIAELESQKEKLMKLDDGNGNLEDKIVAITAERNEIKSQLNDMTEEYEKKRKALERVQVECGNLTARNRAMEQDNKSLECQLAEASEKASQLSELQRRVKETEQLLSVANDDKVTLQAALGDMNKNSEEAVSQWKERAEELESSISCLEGQLEKQEQEALEAIGQWEARCSTLEGIGEDVIRQWEERTESMEADITTLETQLLEKDTALSTLTSKNQALEECLAAECQETKMQLDEKNETIASYEEQIDVLTKEIVSTREESEQVVEQWQERCEQLEANISELNEAILNQQQEATDAIAEWEARCGALNETIEELESQAVDPRLTESLQQSLDTLKLELVEKEADLARSQSDLETARTSASLLEAKLESSLSQLEETMSRLDSMSADHASLTRTLSHKESEHTGHLKVLEKQKDEALVKLRAELDEVQKQMNDTNTRFALKESEWGENEACSVTLREEYERLLNKCSSLEDEKSKLLKERDVSLQETEVVVYELQEELRCAKEELQSFATDQFSVKATEMATNALRQQMQEIRSQYAADQKSLATERELRLVAEEEVTKLKSDIALLSQAAEYDEDVDVHVRKVAKKVSKHFVIGLCDLSHVCLLISN